MRKVRITQDLDRNGKIKILDKDSDNVLKVLNTIKATDTFCITQNLLIVSEQIKL